MEQEHATRNLSESIKLLQEQRDHLTSSLSKLFEDASVWGDFEMPELVTGLNRLSELLNASSTEVKHLRDELDRIEKAGAEEFAKNYVVKPGSNGKM